MSNTTLTYHVPTTTLMTPGDVMNISNQSQQACYVNTNIIYEFDFLAVYGGIHGYLALTVCILGLASNILNVIVLTRRNMRTPLNLLLTSLSLVDMLGVLAYTPSAIGYIAGGGACADDYAWATFSMFKHNMFYVCHAINLWITVALATIRYTFVCKYSLHTNAFTSKRAGIVVLGVVIWALLLNAPGWFTNELSLGADNCWTSAFTPFACANPAMITGMFWFTGVMRILPCLLLLVFSILLMLFMRGAYKKRTSLYMESTRNRQKRESSSISEQNKTTVMLTSIVICSFITQSPEGILTMVAATSFGDQGISVVIPYHLLTLFDLLVLINSTINFVLYLTMSTQFRDAFKNLCLKKSKFVSQKFYSMTMTSEMGSPESGSCASCERKSSRANNNGDTLM